MAEANLPISAVRERAADAIVASGKPKTGIIEADYSEGCIFPRHVPVRGESIDQSRVQLLDMKVRCRKCSVCLADRSRLWTARAFDEVKMASRTWFGTLTKRPELHLRDLALARRWVRTSRHTSFEAETKADQLAILTRIANKDVTKFFKRVRHLAPIRYLLVCELHKSGMPHWHLLLHERGPTIAKRVLEEQWPSGFSHWRLVNEADPQVVFYVCKYLAKDAVARVRASAGYGRARISDKLVGLGPTRSPNGAESDQDCQKE